MCVPEGPCRASKTLVPWVGAVPLRWGASERVPELKAAFALAAVARKGSKPTPVGFEGDGPACGPALENSIPGPR